MTVVTIESIPVQSPNLGARPAGATDPAAAAHSIQQMFDAIAPRYDFLNHFLSAGIDRLWWRRTARAVAPILARPEAVVLDLCCGTGDMTLALDKLRPKSSSSHRDEWEGCNKTAAVPVRAVDQSAPILAVDFSPNMLALAQPKFAGRNIRSIQADALHLPFADASIDLVTCAFGFRNLASYPEGLAELYRVLRPGGQIAILDFNQPTGLIGALYNLYFKRVLPLVGRLISRDASAYAYLPQSVERFPSPPRMIELATNAGFSSPSWTPYTFAIAGLYRAAKP